MVRSKVKYEFVSDERARKETFRKRKCGLLKKVNELKTLCNIDACVIIHNTKDGEMPDVWPSTLEASRLINKFNSFPSASRNSHMMDQEGYLKKSVSSLTKNLEREKKKIRSLEIEKLLENCLVDDNLDGLTEIDDVKEMFSLLERKIQVVNDKIATLQHANSSIAPSPECNRNGSRRGKEKQLL